MSVAAIRTSLKALLDGVTSIGSTHDHPRLATDWETYLSRFKTTIGGTAQIRGWTIAYAGMAEPTQLQMEDTVDGLRPHLFKIRGYLGVDDSAGSEKTAADLAEDVCDALDDSTALHDGQTYYYSSPAQIAVFETRVFGSVLCHFIEIAVTVTEYRS